MRSRAVACILATIVCTAQAQPVQQTSPVDEPAVVEIRRQLTAGRFKDAEAAARAALTQIETRDGADSVSAAHLLDVLVEALWRGNPRAEDAAGLADRVIALKERLYGANHLETARSLHNRGNLLAERGDHKGAQEALERVLRIREAALGEDLAITGALTDLALEVSANGNFPRARTLFERALAIREKRLGPDDPSVATVLNNLGALLKDMGRYADADPVLRRALDIREKADGPDHLSVASVLSNLAFLEIERGRYEVARRMYDRVIAIHQRAYGDTHQVVARTITNIAIATAQSGDNLEARRLFARALDVMEKALGPRHPDVASAMGNLATMDQRMGDLVSARALQERALALRQAILPAGHRDIGESLHNLGSVVREIGDFRTARAMYARALAIREKSLGPQHRAVASTLNNLGAVTRELGEPAAAERFYRRSLGILESSVGPNHLLVAQVLTNLAPVLHDLRQNDAAEAALRRSLSIYETSYGGEHPFAAAAHQNLAFNLHQRGNHAQAQAEYERAFAIRSATLGPNHPEVAQGLAGLATELLEQRQFAEAFRVAAMAESISLEHVRTTAATLPERQALTLAATRGGGIDLALTIAIEHPEAVPDGHVRAFEMLVRGRALVLDEMAARGREQHTNVSRDAEPSRAALAAASRRLANLVVRSASADPKSYRGDLERARAEYETAERVLAERYAAFKAVRAGNRATVDDIVAAMPRDAVLIGYTKYQPQPATEAERRGGSGSRYAAFVVHQDGTVRLVPLASAARIDAMVDRWRTALTATAPTRAGELAARAAGLPLRRAIWDPVAQALPSSATRLVVPEGALNLVNIAALPNDGAGYLVESGAPVHLLSAERDLLALAVRGDQRQTGLLALGGASFGIASGDRNGSIATQLARSDNRGAPCRSLASIQFEPLPGTAREATAVAALWRQSGEAGSTEVSVLSGRAATEAAFKTSAPGRRILHLATHGFVVGEQCGRARSTSRGVGGIAATAAPPQTENPLKLSGLALANANRRATADASGEDGIITAEEIVSLDLSAAEWAVLSACDTGVGEIRAGEGVFGLRRAFAVAGARTTVMSLWSVDDRSTLEWMTALYRARLVDRLSTVDSITRANRSMLQSRRDRKLNTHPFYWAGFVAAGDWR